MIYCIIGNDPKFPPLIKAFFERSLPDEKVTFFIATTLMRKEPICGGFLNLSYEKTDYQSLFSKSKQPKLIILCGVLSPVSHFLEYIPENIPIWWFIWGGELYRNLELVGENFMGAVTRKHYLPFRQKLLSTAKIPRIRSLRLLSKDRALLRRLTCICSQVPWEYHLLIEKGWIQKTCEYADIANFPLEDMVDVGAHPTGVEQDCIQIGNSAAPTNNHLEAFDMIKRSAIDDKKFLVPLSYGDQSYAQVVIKTGQRLFGSRFLPITDFLPLEEYNELVSRCSVVIMNHYRQQALGNILSSLWRGATVALAHEPTHRALSQRGLRLYIFNQQFIETVNLSADSGTSPPDQHNILVKEFGREALSLKLKRLVAKHCFPA